MWQPNRAQWGIIWAATLAIILAWPPGEGSSLAVKCVRWMADPRQALPVMPDPLPMGLGDDGDAVAEHDRQEQEYLAALDRSTLTRVRMRLRETTDPLEPSTARQVLVGLGVVAALAVGSIETRRLGAASR